MLMPIMSISIVISILSGVFALALLWLLLRLKKHTAAQLQREIAAREQFKRDLEACRQEQEQRVAALTRELEQAKTELDALS